MAVSAEHPAGEGPPVDPPVALDALLRTLVEQWPGAVLLFDTGARLTWCNGLAARTLPSPVPLRAGCSARTLFEYWRLSEHWDRYCIEGRSLLLPRVQLRHSGRDELRAVRLRLQPLLRDDVTLATLCVVEEFQPDLLQRLESAVLTARGAVWEWSVAAHEVTLSDGYYQLLGLDPGTGSEPQRFWPSRVHPDDLEAVRQSEVEHARSTDNIFEREYRLQHADGRWLWVLDRGRITSRDSQGRATRMTGMLMDITARRTTEAALRESEARFRRATEIANGLIYEVDLAADVAVRYGLERLTGYAPGEIASSLEGWLDLVVEDDRERLRHAVLANRKSGNRYDIEYRLVTKDGRTLDLWHRGGFVFDAQCRPVRGFGFVEDVSARVQAEEALRASEFRFRAVANLIAGYVFESRKNADGSGTMVYESESFIDVIGSDRAEFERRGGWEHFCDAESYPKILAAGERQRAGMRTDIEVHGHNVLGEEKWLRIRSLPVYDPRTGRRIGNIGAATDITEAKRAELALRRSQSILQTIAEGSAAQLSLFDIDGRCVFVNRTLVGRSPEQLTGLMVEDIVEPDPRYPVRATFDRIVATGIGEGFDRTVTNTLTGGVHRVELRLRPVMAGARVVGVVMNVSDVTALHRQQEGLRLQARIIATLREGVAVADSNGNLRLTNSAFDRMFGYEAGELIGRFGGELSTLPPTAYEKVRQRINAHLGDSDFEPTEFEAQRKDGSRFIASCGFARIEVGGEGRIVAVLGDVTEHKQLQREILQIANREQQRIGSDLHDGLGQELTGVALLLRSLSARLTLSREAGRNDDLEPDVEQIIALVNDAIDSTRSLARGLSPVTAQRDGLVMGLEALVSQTRERYGIKVALVQDLGQFREDQALIDDDAATHLYRIAQESVVNAVRHGKASRITIRLTGARKTLSLSVNDDGFGFAPIVGAQAGGMGLKIMRYRARMIGAELQIESQPGRGTTVQCDWNATGA